MSRAPLMSRTLVKVKARECTICGGIMPHGCTCKKEPTVGEQTEHTKKLDRQIKNKETIHGKNHQT